MADDELWSATAIIHEGLLRFHDEWLLQHIPELLPAATEAFEKYAEQIAGVELDDTSNLRCWISGVVRGIPDRGASHMLSSIKVGATLYHHDFPDMAVEDPDNDFSSTVNECMTALYMAGAVALYRELVKEAEANG